MSLIADIGKGVESILNPPQNTAPSSPLTTATQSDGNGAGLLQRLLGTYNVGIDPDTIKQSMVWVAAGGASLIAFYFILKNAFKK